MRVFVIVTSVLLVFSSVTILGEKDEIEKMLEMVNEEELHEYVSTIQSFGEHPTGSEACNEVKEYLVNEFENYGLAVTTIHWKNGKYEGDNVIATIRGKDNATLILSAHYDSYPTSPGADDDGSGISCLLMAAKIMASYSFQHTIKFVAFSGEEQGMLGSQEYARMLYEENADIIADINVDTVGHVASEEGGRLLRVLSDEASLWITDVAESVAERYNIGLSLYRHGNFPAGDHQSFIDYGYEAVFLVEYDFNENMHTPNDTIEHVNISYLAKVCKLVLATAATIANENFSLRAKFVQPKMGRIYFGDREIIEISKAFPIIIGRIHSEVLIDGNGGIKRVEFYFDGELKGFSYSAPHVYNYTNRAFFTHEIKARAVGEISSDICRIKVRVFNILPPGPPHG